MSNLFQALDTMKRVFAKVLGREPTSAEMGGLYLGFAVGGLREGGVPLAEVQAKLAEIWKLADEADAPVVH